jgi:hypothetical protein
VRVALKQKKIEFGIHSDLDSGPHLGWNRR